MLILKKIKIKNFISIGNQSIEIELANHHKTIVVGYNGTGKSSTLLDSIVYALYGTAYRNINKNQLINSTNKGELLVELDFCIGENNYKIIRGQLPNIFDIYVNDVKLNELSSVKEQQKYLEKNIIKINYLTFSNIAILGSCNYIPFMEQPILVRRTLIEELLDINLFAQMLVVAKEQNKELFDQIKSINNDIKSANEQILLIESFITTITNTVAIDNTQEINKLIEQKQNVNQQILTLNNIKINLEEQLSKIQNPQSQLSKIKNHVADFNASIKIDTKQIKFYESNDNCPTCSQSIDLNLKNNSILTCNNNISELNKQLERAKLAITQKQNILLNIQNLETDKKDCEYKIKNLNNEISSIDNRINKLSIIIPTSNSVDLKEYENKLLTTKNLLSSLYDKLSSIKLKKTNYEVVVKILSDSGIKSKILEKYLPYFNSYINNYLNIFGLNINFKFNSLFKEVINSKNRENFSYESFSEGEKMKISLAIMLSFRDLASLKSTNSTNLLIMDEVFDSSLDYDSNNNLMEIINGMVDNNIFIITHRNDVAVDDFDRIMKFSKVNEFTKIDYSTN